MRRFLLFFGFCLFASLALAADPLPPALAFRPSAQALDEKTVEVRFTIAKGYYLYRDKFRFAASAGVSLGAPLLPPGKEKADPTFGRVEVYYDEARIRLPVERNASGTLPLVLTVTSQGCADMGICYPPETQTITLDLPAFPAAASPVSAPAGMAAGADESGRIAQWLAQSSVGLIAAGFFGFGLLLAFTPCVFPMIPIVSGIVVGSGGAGRVSPGRGLALSAAYVLGMAVAYAAAGVAAGLTGTLLSNALQNAWVLGGFALVFVALALSMFGFYEVQLPSFLQSRLSEKTARLPGGSLPGVALMGAISALIVGPCVAAPLAGALLYIGQTGDAPLGGLALFCMALGMGVPLLLVGASAGALLPKSGPWMKTVKAVFGVVLLATALWLVSSLIPAAVELLAWAALLIVPAVFLHALDPLPPHARGSARFWKGIGVLMLIGGVALMIGALSGARDPLQPLAGLFGGTPKESLQFERVRSLDELNERLKRASAPVMLDFYADWCVSCKEMERYTFAEARVREALAGWTLLRADVTANSAEDRALLARFNLFGPPGIVFFDRDGEEQKTVRVVGFQKAEEFLAALNRLSR